MLLSGISQFIYRKNYHAKLMIDVDLQNPSQHANKQASQPASQQASQKNFLKAHSVSFQKDPFGLSEYTIQAYQIIQARLNDSTLEFHLCKKITTL